MDRGDWLTIIVALITALIAATPGLIALWQNRKKNAAETARTHAETENIHAQVADRWAEHVDELMKRVKALEELAEQDAITNRNLKAQIESLTSTVEVYRMENADLKDWAERLTAQFKKHLPKVTPEPYISRKHTGELHVTN